MQDGVGTLGLPEQVAERRDAVERRVELRLGPPSEESLFHISKLVGLSDVRHCLGV